MEFLLLLIADMFGTPSEDTSKIVEQVEQIEPEKVQILETENIETPIGEPIPETPNLFNVIQFR